MRLTAFVATQCILESCVLPGHSDEILNKGASAMVLSLRWNGQTLSCH